MSAEKKHTFKVGDRVRIYGNTIYGNPSNLLKGVVEKLGAEGFVFVRTDDVSNTMSSCCVHEKQCRRLKKKNPPRVWILRGHPSACPSNYVHKPILGPELALDERVIVEEVRRGKNEA